MKRYVLRFSCVEHGNGIVTKLDEWETREPLCPQYAALSAYRRATFPFNAIHSQVHTSADGAGQDLLGDGELHAGGEDLPAIGGVP